MDSSLSGDDTSFSGDEEIRATMPGISQSKATTSVGPVRVADGYSTSGAGNGNTASGITGDGNNTSRKGQQSSESPRGIDVLLGRGRPYQNYSGNKRMLRIVSQYKEEYIARPRDQKRAFVETVLDAVIKDGTKFLRRVEVINGSNYWEEVDRLAAAEKVWHALRCKDRPTQRRDKRQAGDGEGAPALPAAGVANHGETQCTGNSAMGGNALNTFGMLSTIPGVDTLLVDIQVHLAKAVTASNLLASMLVAPSAGIGNHFVPPKLVPKPAQQYAQPKMGNHLPTQPSAGTATALLGHHDSFCGQSAPLAVQQRAQQYFPLNYTNTPGLANHGLPGVVDFSRSPFASMHQHGQPPQSRDPRNQVLAQAVSILMQAAQQGTLSPP